VCAQVVAADLNTSSSKDFVEFKVGHSEAEPLQALSPPAPLPVSYATAQRLPPPQIHVADDAEEWTVSRRYRNFESLHRQLRFYPAYRLKLPPKRIFVHSNK
jgi:sorting nexin-13